MTQVSRKGFDTTSFLIGCVCVLSILGAFLAIYKNKKEQSLQKIILEKIPNEVVMIDPLSNQQMKSNETVKKGFQLQFSSTSPMVGWLSFITDQGQPLSDHIAIGASMSSFPPGQRKTFPVVLHHPTISKDYHMVFVLCDASGVETIRPKIQEVERYMRIGAMGGKLPRGDCSTVHFRL